MCAYSYKSPVRDAKVKTMTSQSPKHLTFPIWRIVFLYFFVFKNLFKHGSHSAKGADFQWAVQLQ